MSEPPVSVAPPRGWIRRSVLILGVFCHGIASLLLVVGLVGRFGGAFPKVDIVNHLAPIWLAGGLMSAVLGWRLCGACRGVSAALVGALLTLTAAIVGPEFLGARQSAAPASGPPIRIVQFNVWKDNAAPDRAARWILAQDADVVVLEEAARSGGRIRDALRGRYPYRVDCLGAERRCSTVILSMRPPIDSGGLARGDPENRGALSAVWARFDHPAGPFTVIGAHYMRPWPYSDQTRGQNQLIRFVRGRNQDRMILVGDFNATPWSFALQRQDRAWTLTRVTRGLPTWPNADGLAGKLRLPPILPLDQVYIGQDWRKTAIRRGPRLGSDHYPLVVDLRALQGAP